jgi:hypothetical protein
MTTTNYDKEKALEKIESFVSQRSEERVELENKIISLIPRMNDLHDIVKKCLDNDISTNLFFAEKEPQKVGFFKTNEGLEKYFGVLGGGSLGSNLYVNLNLQKIIYLGSSVSKRIKQMRKVVNDFDEYEKQVYKFIDNL